MRRLVLLLAGAALLVLPLRMLYNWMVPLPPYRVGTFADFEPMVRACVALYGGAFVGLLARRLVTRNRAPAALVVFLIAFAGALIGVVFAAVVAGRSNLVGLVVILGTGLGAIVAGGIALLLAAVRVSSR
jgi:hypothetical protein